MFGIKKESAWQFITSATGGAGVEFVAAEGGRIYLQSPAGGQVVFTYGGAGLGLSAGLKLPKIGRIQFRGRSFNVAGAPAAFPNTGAIYILDNFLGDELTQDDITGVCIFAEISGGLVGGGSATAMLLGMDPLWLAGVMVAAAAPVLEPAAVTGLLASATGVLLMAGLNLGIQAGGGAAVYVGGLI
jgi:hypothetical protein